MDRLFHVEAHRDRETGYWWAESDDIPGFVTEARTFDDLVDRARAVIGELLTSNDLPGAATVEFRTVQPVDA